MYNTKKQPMETIIYLFEMSHGHYEQIFAKVEFFFVTTELSRDSRFSVMKLFKLFTYHDGQPGTDKTLQVFSIYVVTNLS